jgi:hypothetical protein
MQSFAWGAHGAPLGKLQISLFKPNSQQQDEDISALIPMKNFVILKSVLDLFEVF